MTSPFRPTGGCGGDGCASARDPWPLHHIRHRGVYCRLCSSCVLLYHPSLFCSSCLLLLPPTPDSAATSDDPFVAAGEVVKCSRCPAVSHLSCLGSAATAAFVCASCAAAADGARFSYLPPPAGAGEVSGRRRLDGRTALVLLIASRLASASMGRAAAAARADAERKVRDAAVARKRARDMLETAFLAAAEEASNPPKNPNGSALEPKKKVAKVNEMATGAKKPQPGNRDRDKLLKFNAIPPLPVHGAIGSGDVKKMAFAAAAAAAARGSVGVEPPLPREEKKAAPHLGGNVKEETNSPMTTQGAAAIAKDERRRLFGSLPS